MMAPVDGSGSCPAWMHTVEKRAVGDSFMSKRPYLSLLSFALQFAQSRDDALRAASQLLPHVTGSTVHFVVGVVDRCHRHTALHRSRAHRRGVPQSRRVRVARRGGVAGGDGNRRVPATAPLASSGLWRHTQAPAEAPGWLAGSTAGFHGTIAVPPADPAGDWVLVLRAVVPTRDHTRAVVADLPIDSPVVTDIEAM